MLHLRFIYLLLLSLLASGCANISGPVDPRDPYEGFNRAMYSFNDGLDRMVLRPIAEGYEAITPQPVSTGISNFFSNLDDVLVLLNDLLQLKFEQAMSDLARITWNTTVGLFGLIDVASGLDLPKHNEDFGQTLGYWGVGSGSYLVLPFFGPSSFRDGVGFVVDWQTDPQTYVKDQYTRWGMFAVDTIDTRANLLRASNILETAALDPYAFMRDAYLQRRRSLVYDGKPPQEDEFDPFAEDFDPLSE